MRSRVILYRDRRQMYGARLWVLCIDGRSVMLSTRESVLDMLAYAQNCDEILL